ncbi:hypothetical protein LB941_00975 [Ligilactobacillus sp. WILCCON 0076]|uniref:Uncharacterized protein n=1 Tax=Ligilactobacillus ubinensis TaxID=2876789 RepID=A0A9X2FJC3_9LACO|nr:hypothetical protein [Ligilactobacillus ubinensis]MCP0885906.1 hypothetical protein [Ligilactobacillus ubinensis]
MKTFFKKYWWLILIFLVGIPLIVNIGIGLIPGNGSNDGWLGFWGGYLGAVVSIVGIFWSVNKQNSFEKSLEKERNKPILVPISKDFRDLPVTTDLKKLTNSKESYNGTTDLFSDLFFMLVNGSGKNIYDIRCEFTMVNLEKLKPMYNPTVKGTRIIGNEKISIDIKKNDDIVFNFTNGYSTLEKQDVVYTISYIGAGDLKKVSIPVTIFPFLKTYVVWNVGIARPFLTSVKNILPFYKVSLSYKDFELREHNMTFEINFYELTYKGNLVLMNNFYTSLKIKPENINNLD